MFTVKARSVEGREYVICDVEEVQYFPGSNNSANSVIAHFSKDKGSVEYTSENYCDVFVMNEAGKTVARYEW